MKTYMKSILKTTLTFLIILAAVFFIKPWEWHVQIKKNHQTLAQKLELTPEQIEFEKLLRKENRAEIKPIVWKLEKEEKIYKVLIAKKAPTKEILKEKEYSDIQKGHMIKFEKILTKEQKDKFMRIKTRLFMND